MNVGSAPHDQRRFRRLRDEIWWEVGRKLTETGGWDLSGLDDRTAADLTAPRWKPGPRGTIDVEPKDDTRERLGRSPDDADALLLAFDRGGVTVEQYLAHLPKPAEEPPLAGLLNPAQVPVDAGQVVPAISKYLAGVRRR